jgi:hypothetical protein
MRRVSSACYCMIKCVTYIILEAGDLLWREGALIQILDCKRQIVALCHQLSEHCVQLFSVTMTTHNIGNVQAQLTQS